MTSRDEDYDLEAFEDGRRAGYMQGRREAEHEAIRLVGALVRAAGGRVEIPENVLVDDQGWVIKSWDDPARNVRVYQAKESVTKGSDGTA